MPELEIYKDPIHRHCGSCHAQPGESCLNASDETADYVHAKRKQIPWRQIKDLRPGRPFRAKQRPTRTASPDAVTYAASSRRSSSIV